MNECACIEWPATTPRLKYAAVSLRSSTPALERLVVELHKIVAARAVVDRARFHFMRNRPGDRPSRDIVAITNAYNQAISWMPVLNAGQNRIRVTTNQAWDDRFYKFNV